MFWPSSLQFWGPLLGCCAPFPSAASVSGGQRFARVLPGCGVPFPSATSGADSQRLGALSTGTPRLFPPRRAARAAGGLPRPLPPRPQRAPQVGSQEVFRQEPGPVCRVGGGGFSGAEFAPCPPPPTSSGDGAALLCSFSVPLFCEPPAVCSGRSIFLSLSHSLKKTWSHFKSITHTPTHTHIHTHTE